ncbi:hypothetical protein [Clavibacter tessellarius]|uniref:ABC-2 family transporter protein n=1 Tax=Clavibacter tessellarius TaxID=31965 RepID=A0A154UZK2_9MICO|nr:hypothetical protein [Clavibacter michiganensis]KZC94562.1 hypothetical protein AWH51_12675 [Clavibacter michiganensis subsp. tessellarius]
MSASHGTATATATASRGQRWAHVASAELHRSVQRGALRGGLIWAAGLALLAGAGARAFTGAFADPTADGAALVLTLPIELAATVFGVAFALAVLGNASRDTTDGTVLTSLALVPRRGRLLSARAVAPTALGALGVLGVAAVLAAVHLIADGPSPATVSALLVATAVATLTTAAVVLLVFLTATVLRRGAAAMAVFMLVVLVLPIAVSVLTVVGPVPLRGPADVLLAVLPGTLALKAMSTATIAAEGPATVLAGLAGLVAWCGAAGLLAARALSREGDG